MTCSGPLYDLAKRFVGTWKEYTVTPEGEILVGTLQVDWEPDGCVILQRFHAAEGQFAFIAFGYLNPDSNAWEETFSLNTGRVAHYRWREVGDEIIMDRLGGDLNNLRRLNVHNLTFAVYDVFEERSTDGGQTWEVVEVTRTRREVADE